MLTCFSAFIFRFCHPFNIIVWIILFCCCWWCWQWWCWWWFRNFKGKNRTKQNIKRSGEMFTKSFYSSSLCHFAYSESRLLLSHVYAYDVYRCIARVQCTRIISMYGLVYTNLWMFCGSVTNTCIKIWWDETSRVCLPLNCTNWETQTHAHTTHSSILQNHRKTINVCFKTINPVKSVFIRERKRARARVSLWFILSRAQLNHFEQQQRNNKKSSDVNE